MTFFRTPLALVLGLLVVSSVGSARAAETGSFSLDHAPPAPPGGPFFVAPTAAVADDRVVAIAVVGSYASDPLVLVGADDGAREGAVVSDLFLLHLGASGQIWPNLSLDLDLPVALVAQGDDPVIDGTTYVSPGDAGLGDVRLGARYRFFGKTGAPLELAGQLALFLPTGDPDKFLGDGSTHASLAGIANGVLRSFVWSASLGSELRGSVDYAGTTQGTTLRYALGAAARVGPDQRITFGPELYGSLVLEDPAGHTAHSELLVGGRFALNDEVELGLSGGPGLGTGVGTPAARVFMGFAYAPHTRPPSPDRDRDGVPDGADICPDERGARSSHPERNGCPERLDRDEDGIADSVDVCPMDVGVASDDAAKNGCPAQRDADRDGVADEVDACPNQAGVATADPKRSGCPSDKDGDGVSDADDACPDVRGVKSPEKAQNGCLEDADRDGISDDQDACFDQAGVPDPDPLKHGCPRTSAAVLSGNSIVITQAVLFERGKDVILKESSPLLDDVAHVLVDHPELTRVEVQGHTDDSGSGKRNAALSRARAEAVVDALVERGISKERLVAKGFGAQRPVASNGTAEGREKNRRVEFRVLERLP
jgi:OOP family OmpA-OmpF porin